MARVVAFTLVVAVLALVDGRAANISNTWVLPEDDFPVFYRYFRDRINWFEADAVCQFHHASLVTVDNGAQFDATRAFLKELDVATPVWVGLRRPQDKPLFYWRNEQPLSMLGFWSEPLPASYDELCAAADPASDFRWHGLACGGLEVASFVCELPVPDWATARDGCMLENMPSLTAAFLPEEAAVQLTSDCGLGGTRRVVCKGNTTREALLAQLNCHSMMNEDATPGPGFGAPGSPDEQGDADADADDGPSTETSGVTTPEQGPTRQRRATTVTSSGAKEATTHVSVDTWGPASSTDPSSEPSTILESVTASPAISPSPGSLASLANPASPASPISQANPASPISPINPASPASPVSHTNPASPASPVSHANPASPASLISHTNPAIPASSISHTNPVSPTSSFSHTNPASPVSHTNPASTISRTNPTSPAVPISHTSPASTISHTNPASPSSSPSPSSGTTGPEGSPAKLLQSADTLVVARKGELKASVDEAREVAVTADKTEDIPQDEEGKLIIVPIVAKKGPMFPKKASIADVSKPGRADKTPSTSKLQDARADKPAVPRRVSLSSQPLRLDAEAVSMGGATVEVSEAEVEIHGPKQTAIEPVKVAVTVDEADNKLDGSEFTNHMAGDAADDLDDALMIRELSSARTPLIKSLPVVDVPLPHAGGHPSKEVPSYLVLDDKVVRKPPVKKDGLPAAIAGAAVTHTSTTTTSTTASPTSVVPPTTGGVSTSSDSSSWPARLRESMAGPGGKARTLTTPPPSGSPLQSSSDSVQATPSPSRSPAPPALSASSTTAAAAAATTASSPTSTAAASTTTTAAPTPPSQSPNLHSTVDVTTSSQHPDNASVLASAASSTSTPTATSTARSEEMTTKENGRRRQHLPAPLLSMNMKPDTEDGEEGLDSEPQSPPRPNRSRSLVRQQHRNFYPYFLNRVLGR